MANRAYLIKTSKENSEELFESNNTIPLFWFTLLDKEIIEKFGQKIIDFYHKYYDSEEQDEDDEAVNIEIPKQRFLKNASEGAKFVKENYRDKMILFNDFIKYLDTKFEESDILELNILEIGHFDSIENTISEIKNIVTNIKDNVNEIYTFTTNDSITSFVGFDDFCENDFRNYSKDYLEECLEIEKERQLRNKESAKQSAKEKVKDKFKNVFMCVGGIAFIGASVLIITQGNYFLGIVGIIFGGIALLFGVLNLKG